MPDLLDPTEIMFTSFEPKIQNRFVMEVVGLPSYVIKTCERPKLTFEEIVLDHINVKRYVKGKGEWGPINVTLYDPIVPSSAQAVMEWVRLSHESVTGRDGYSDFYKKDLTIHVLGPVGDKVEEWSGKGGWIVNPDFGSLDWSSNEPVEITLSIRCDYWVLQF